MIDPMIVLENISKGYEGRIALAPFDLDVSTGKITVLIGPSGCGKSTVIRLIAGLIAPDTGAVQFNGEVVTVASLAAIRRRIGYVVQDGGLFPHLTAAENIALMARYVGWQADDIQARLVELASLTHFPEDDLSRYPVQLSGGQRQRVALMRALMLDPDVLLLDEPLGALDPMIRYELQTELRDIFRSLNKTVVLVTHDMGEAGYFGDTTVLMCDGKIVQQGTLNELIEAPAEPFVADFIRAQRGLHDSISELKQ